MLGSVIINCLLLLSLPLCVPLSSTLSLLSETEMSRVRSKSNLRTLPPAVGGRKDHRCRLGRFEGLPKRGPGSWSVPSSLPSFLTPTLPFVVPPSPSVTPEELTTVDLSVTSLVPPRRVPSSQSVLGTTRPETGGVVLFGESSRLRTPGLTTPSFSV